MPKLIAPGPSAAGAEVPAAAPPIPRLPPVDVDVGFLDRKGGLNVGCSTETLMTQASETDLPSFHAHLALAEELWEPPERAAPAAAQAPLRYHCAFFRFHEPMRQHGDLVCIELRRCRGCPLFPDGFGNWILVDPPGASQRHRFTLTQYLQTVLYHCCPGADIKFFPGIGTESLVPYQTFVRAEQVDRLLAELQEPFEQMRRAFHQCKAKGGVAPDLLFGGQHKFVPLVPQRR